MLYFMHFLYLHYYHILILFHLRLSLKLLNHHSILLLLGAGSAEIQQTDI